MTLDQSPAGRATGAPRRRLLSIALALSVGLTAMLVLGPGQGLGNPGPKRCTDNGQNGRLCLTVSDTPDPVAYSTPTRASYFDYRAVLSNEGGSNLSHVGLDVPRQPNSLPSQITFFKATTSKGTCSYSAATRSVSCAIGSLSRGQSATVDVVVIAPTAAGSNPPDATITLSGVTGSFDENVNDNPNGGKVDTVLYDDVLTTATKTTNATYVPASTDQTPTSGEADTSSGLQTGSATIRNPWTDVLGTVNLSNSDPSFGSSFCPDTGQVKLPGSNKTYVCRQGDYLEASVTTIGDGSHYHSDAVNPPRLPLVFHLQWADSLVPSKQTNKNFVVFYEPDGSTSLSDVQVISDICNDGATNLPCLRNVSVGVAASSVDVVRADNGRMK